MSRSWIALPPVPKNKDNCAPLREVSAGVTISKPARPDSNVYKYPVSSRLLARSRSNPASSKISNEDRRQTILNTCAVLMLQPSAVGLGIKPFSILNRLDSSFPHQP